jgi:Flp pilus assembly pilin Flp
MHRCASRGQSLIEYGLIFVLVTLIAVVVIFVWGPAIAAAYQHIRDAL